MKGLYEYILEGNPAAAAAYLLLRKKIDSEDKARAERIKNQTPVPPEKHWAVGVLIPRNNSWRELDQIKKELKVKAGVDAGDWDFYDDDHNLLDIRGTWKKDVILAFYDIFGKDLVIDDKTFVAKSQLIGYLK